VYSSPINISSTTTLKAKAWKAGMDPSGTASATYIISGGPGSGAEVYLYWDFEDVTTQLFRTGGEPYVDAIVNMSTTADIAGNGRDGEMNNTLFGGWQPGDPLPAIIEDSPIGDNGKAVHFRADGTIQRVRNLDSVGTTTFDTGISMRAIWQLDEEPPASSRYALMQQGGPSWQNDTMQVNWDKYATEYIGVQTTAGGVIRSTSALRSSIEAAIGHSIIGEPTVFTATYDGTEIALYADGIKVASEIYGTFVPPGTGYNRFEIGNDGGSCNCSSRKAIVDEFSVWIGALTAEEVGLDYRQLAGIVTCADILAQDLGITSDLSMDCRVNVDDFILFALEWLDTGAPGSIASDFTGNGSVDDEDLDIFVSEWLSCMPAVDVICP
jgi:hypothetical protein